MNYDTADELWNFRSRVLLLPGAKESFIGGTFASGNFRSLEHSLPGGTTVPGGRIIIIQDLYSAMESEDTEARGAKV